MTPTSSPLTTTTLGTTDLIATPVGLGCWQLGADWGDAPDPARAQEIVEAAWDSGVRFFDTADVYGDGRSERLLGEILADRRDELTIATKFGRAGGIYPAGYSRDSLRRAVEASLRRLGTDRIDLLQLHCIPTEVLREGNIFDWLRELQAEGLLWAFGASVETIEEGLLCLNQSGIASLQIILNVLRQRTLDELVPAASAAGVGIIARVPLASGVLSGRFGRGHHFAASDHRNYNRDGDAFNVGETFGGLRYEDAVRLAERLESEFLPRYRRHVDQEVTLAQFALRWVIDQAGVTTVIPGASSPDQARANARVAELPQLSEELHESLQAFYRAEVDEHVRGPY